MTWWSRLNHIPSQLVTSLTVVTAGTHETSSESSRQCKTSLIQRLILVDPSHPLCKHIPAAPQESRGGDLGHHWVAGQLPLVSFPYSVDPVGELGREPLHRDVAVVPLGRVVAFQKWRSCSAQISSPTRLRPSLRLHRAALAARLSCSWELGGFQMLFKCVMCDTSVYCCDG